VDELEITLVIPRSAHDPAAYDLYLQGLYYSNKSSEEDLRKALSLFQQALDRDPNFASAWTGVAKAWLWLADVYVKPLDAYPLVKAAASKALTLDDHDAEAHCYLGEAERVLNWNPAGEDAELRRALEIDPNSAVAYFYLMLVRSSEGFLDEGLAAAEMAHKLDPLSPLVTSFASVVYSEAGRGDESMAYARRTRELDPNYIYPEDALAWAYRQQGKLDEAIALYEKDQAAFPVPSAGLAIAYARAGRREDARRVLGDLLEDARKHYVAGDTIAPIYVALGDNDEAFRWLERAYAEHSAPLSAVGVREEFRPLHADPRFADLLRRIGLDPVKILSQ
jgi:tetratricopeptide (TPR) repeat protein